MLGELPNTQIENPQILFRAADREMLAHLEAFVECRAGYLILGSSGALRVRDENRDTLPVAIMEFASSMEGIIEIRR
jgi:hypothetical protein